MKRFVMSGVVALAFACGRTSSVTPPPPPATAPAAVVEEAPARTLSEARSVRRRGDLDAYQRALEELVRNDDPKTAARAEALLGLFLFDQKRFEEAVPVLQRAAQHEGPIAPFLRLRLIEAESGRGSLAGAISAAAQIVATAPNTSAATIARLRLPALYTQADDPAAAEAAFQQTLLLPIDELSERDFVDLGSLLENAGRADLAAQLRMRILRQYPEGRYTEKTFGELLESALAPLDALTLDESVQLASDLARVNRYEQALTLLRKIEQRFPDAEMNDLYRKVRLRALFNSRNYSQLLSETEDQRLPDPALLLLRARAAWRDDKPSTFLAGLAEIEKRFPESREAIDAKVQRAKYYSTDEVDYEKSIANLQKALAAGASGNEGENLWTVGWIYFRAGEHDQALKTFDQYIASYPDGDYKTNSLFWSAKIHDRHGRTAERDARLRQVMLEYPYSYYSYRAREILGEPAVAPAEVPNGLVFPDVDGQLASLADPRFEAVRELMEVDLLRDASREMKTLAAAYPENLAVAFMLADVYVAAGEPFKANGILQRRFRQFVRHGGSNIPPRFWEILFPLGYWETLRAEAEKRGLDPYLLASIIRQESGFEPTTVSNAGAVGLMQIMPEEAARIASIAGIEGITRERLFDPEENIAVGAAEYSQKLGTMGGNPILAIAAYNAGEQAVGRWIAQTPLDDLDLFVEAIPYAETRLYVKTVTRNRFEYRRIYESSTAVQQFP
jgi:soluble lytic murein transglycosylase